MRRASGFTLIELLVAIAIVGILAGMAVPAYRTWQQRARGSEASIMMKQILDGQIMYYLENDSFFPAVGSTLIIPPRGPLTVQEQQWLDQIKSALKVTIHVDHTLGYTIVNYGIQCNIVINALSPIFEEGHSELHGHLDKDGQLRIFSPW